MLTFLHMRSKTLLVATSVLILFGLTTFLRPMTVLPKSKSVQEPIYGGELFIGLAVNPNTLNPQICVGCEAVSDPIFDSLLRYDEDHNLIPELATTVPTGKFMGNNWTITFELRDDLHWHDGAPLTIDDVVWSYKLFFNWTAVKNWYEERFHLWVFITKLDDRHVKFELSSLNKTTGHWTPFEWGSFFDIIPTRFVILPKHLLANSPDWLTDSYFEAPIGSGPFMFDSSEPGNFWRLVRNPSYYLTDEMDRQLPFLDAITFKVYPDDEAMMTAFLEQEIDVIRPPLSPVDRKTLQKAAEELGVDIAFSQRPGGPAHAVTYNTQAVCTPDPLVETTTCLDTGMRPLNDTHVRQALTLAVNKTDLLNRHYDGEGMYSPTQITPAMPWVYNDDPALQEYMRYDPEEAARLLDEAGYPATFVTEDPFYGIQHWRFDGWDFRLLIPNSFQNEIEALKTIGRYWQEIGIQNHVVSLDSAQYQLEIYDTGEFEAYSSSYSSIFDPLFWWNKLRADEAVRVPNDNYYDDGLNAGFWIHAEFTALGHQAQNTTDLAEQAHLYKRMQEIAATEQPMFFYHVADVWNVYHTTFAGFRPGLESGGLVDKNSLQYVYYVEEPPPEPETTTPPKTTSAPVTPEWPQILVILLWLSSNVSILVIVYKHSRTRVQRR